MSHKGASRILTLARAMALALLLMTGVTGRAAASDLTVFAAASLKTALEDVADAWRAETGKRVTLAFAGSSALARQIEAGAPADLFISANTAWMDHLAAAGLIRPETRRDLLGNDLVLIGHGRDAPPVRLAPDPDLAARLGEGRLAMALVDAVPAGIYGKAALTRLGLWDAVADRVAQTDNVRAALALVARGEAPFGIVYATDAGAADSVSIVARFPADTHPPIVYPVAQVAGRDHPDAAGFLAFLTGETAAALFARHGFRSAE
ncbi:molybdate ABC transporter substrate-binding protein [Stappia sp.]|uniref:molybdate ABC transporter substrate-binding protein n=1 Tax=Stappia sp. TaxID=1870903 RepID=UPI0032D8C893